MNLKEQVVIVTGAGRGLGTDIAKAFAREGARVAINYRNSKDEAEKLALSMGDMARPFQADVRDAQAVENMVSEVTKTLGGWYRVELGPIKSFREGEALRRRLEKQGIVGSFIRQITMA